MLQAEFSILDFKATEEPTKVQLPLYIELKGKRMDTGCGTLTVCCHALLQARLHNHTLWKHIMSSANACASILGSVLCGSQIVAMHARTEHFFRHRVISCMHKPWRAGCRNLYFHKADSQH